MFNGVFDLSAVSNLADDWYFAYVDDSIQSYGQGASSYSLVNINSFIDPFGIFSMDIFDDQHWTIFGSSVGTSVIDIFLGNGSISSTFNTDVISSLTQSLSFFSPDGIGGSINVGGLGVTGNLIATYNSDGTIAPVPLAKTGFYLIFSLLAIGAIRKYQKEQPRRNQEKQVV